MMALRKVKLASRSLAGRSSRRNMALQISKRKASLKKGSYVGTAYGGLAGHRVASLGRSALGLTSGFGLAQLGITLGKGGGGSKVTAKASSGYGLSKR
jgi:hypothetical protein